jgi:hypothetical protein
MGQIPSPDGELLNKQVKAIQTALADAATVLAFQSTKAYLEDRASDADTFDKRGTKVLAVELLSMLRDEGWSLEQKE